MKRSAAKTPSQLQSRNRSRLLVSLVLFLIALFALVSHWHIAPLMIVLACAFHLVSGGVFARRYREACTRALMERALDGRFPVTGYCASAPADNLLERKGFTPPLPLVPGARLHHVLRAAAGSHPFTLAEASFVRRQEAPRGMCSAGGTLITVEDILSPDEQWLICAGDPLLGLCSEAEYAKGGFVRMPDFPEGLTAYRVAAYQSFSACAQALPAAKDALRFALAARGGSLSLFSVGSFFSPDQIDSSKPFDSSLLEGFHLPELSIMIRVLEALGGQEK